MFDWRVQSHKFAALVNAPLDTSKKGRVAALSLGALVFLYSPRNYNAFLRFSVFGLFFGACPYLFSYLNFGVLSTSLPGVAVSKLQVVDLRQFDSFLLVNFTD